METRSKLACKCLIHHTVTLNTRFTSKGWRCNFNKEMRLTSFTCASMTLVKSGLIHYIEENR